MRYHNITKDDMLNGDGLRVVLWVSGCSHCCKDCQNPITWDPESGLAFDEAAKEEIFEQLGKSYISGITFSGGDRCISERAGSDGICKRDQGKISGQDYMALHRIPVGRTTGKRDSEIPGRAGGRQVCGGEEGYCPEMERQFQPEGD